MTWIRGGCFALLALAAVPAAAQDSYRLPQSQRPELVVGVLAHGVNLFYTAPPGLFIEGTEEHGTADVEIILRSATQTRVFQPRLTAKLQINTAGRTSFASVGAEWRQHVLRNRVYGQIGIGIAANNGYRFTPDPFVPGLPLAEALRRYDVYTHRTSLGSNVTFNPSLSVGVRINPRWAIEAAFEHYSHARIFTKQNPGLDSLGLRLVRVLGPR